MPIRAEVRHLYGKAWREETRPRILARAGGKCEQCKVPDRAFIFRHDRLPGWWVTYDGELWNDHGYFMGYVRGSEMGMPDRGVKIVLTIAHLNQTPGDDRDENLKALCQYCHLAHDREVNRAQSRETRLDRKDGARPLIVLLRGEQ